MGWLWRTVVHPMVAAVVDLVTHWPLVGLTLAAIIVLLLIATPGETR